MAVLLSMEMSFISGYSAVHVSRKALQSVILSTLYPFTCHIHAYMHMQDGETPLMAAVQKGHLEAARVLLVECNCNANAKSLVGYSVYLTVHSTPHAQHIRIICASEQFS